MKIDKVAIITPNWKITKATDETLARILVEKLHLKESVHNVELFIQRLQNKHQETLEFLGKVLRNYQGNFESDLKIFEAHNIIPQVLRYQFATLLTGTSPASTFNANYIAL